MNSSKPTKTEIDTFNREWEIFEQWRDGVLKEKPVKDKPYNFDGDAPDEPKWHKNLQKAHRVRQEQKILRDAIRDKDKNEALPLLEEVRINPDAWRDYCEKHEKKRKPGRPKLPNHLKKKTSYLKRSDQMKKLLEEHQIHIIEKPSANGPWTDLLLKEHPDWQFLPNGRLQYREEPPISVHLFLKNLDTK